MAQTIFSSSCDMHTSSVELTALEKRSSKGNWILHYQLRQTPRKRFFFPDVQRSVKSVGSRRVRSQLVSNAVKDSICEQAKLSYARLDERIWSLALPAVASLLLDPFLGAVDTAFIGRVETCEVSEALGGLAISTTVFNFTFKVFNFLSVVTGPLVAKQFSSAQKVKTAIIGHSGVRFGGSVTDVSLNESGRQAASGTVKGAMVLALLIGVFASAILELNSDVILSLAGGEAAAKAETAPLTSSSIDETLRKTQVNTSLMTSQAELYLRIRALGAPAALVGTVAVGTYRGILDTRTPLLVTGAANAVNLLLDPLLIFGFGPVPAFGVAGAAVATVVAEWTSAFTFWALLSKERLLPSLRHIFTSKDTGRFFTGEGLDDLTNLTRTLMPFASGSFSQLLRTILLQIVLFQATASAAVSGAAGSHQVCIQVWWLSLFALDALAVAAQSLVAAALGAGDIVAAREAADRTLQYALASGTVCCVGLLAAAPVIPTLFTSDGVTATVTEEPLRLIAFLQPLNAVVFVGDGILQGAADFDFLAVAMALAALPALASLSPSSLSGDTVLGAGYGLTSVWRSVALLQIGRGASLAARYWDPVGPLSIESDNRSRATGSRDATAEVKDSLR